MILFPTVDPVQTGVNIVRLRKAAGLTVHDLQLAFGFNSPQAIYKWQQGAALPTIDNLVPAPAGMAVNGVMPLSLSWLTVSLVTPSVT